MIRTFQDSCRVHALLPFRTREIASRLVQIVKSLVNLKPCDIARVKVKMLATDTVGLVRRRSLFANSLPMVEILDLAD